MARTFLLYKNALILIAAAVLTLEMVLSSNSDEICCQLFLLFIVDVFYLQETKLDATSKTATAPQLTKTISAICPTCSTSTKYGISAWVYKVDWVSNWNCPLRVSNDIT